MLIINLNTLDKSYQDDNTQFHCITWEDFINTDIINDNVILTLPVDIDGKILHDYIQKIKQCDYIHIIVPSHADGRFFTLARLLRERIQYHGIIRLDGHIIPDQYHYAYECGVDAVILDNMLAERLLSDGWDKSDNIAFDHFISTAYQPSLAFCQNRPQKRLNIWQQRHHHI